VAGKIFVITRMLRKVFALLFGVFASRAAADLANYTPIQPKVDGSTWANIEQVQTYN